MFAICYVTVFAFHPYLKLNSVIVERSFGHSLEELTSLNYLARDQLLYHDRKTLLKLKYFALDVHKRNSKAAILHMFTTELKFPSEVLLGWFSKKIYMKVELRNKEKLNYKFLIINYKFPMDIKKDKFHICYFPLDLLIELLNEYRSDIVDFNDLKEEI